jgi:hypothetical protein
VMVRGGDSAGHIAFLDHVDQGCTPRRSRSSRALSPTLDPGVKTSSRLHHARCSAARRDQIAANRRNECCVDQLNPPHSQPVRGNKPPRLLSPEASSEVTSIYVRTKVERRRQSVRASFGTAPNLTPQIVSRSSKRPQNKGIIVSRGVQRSNSKPKTKV